jgi:hypothetical protein
MAKTLATGSQFAIASAYGTVRAFTSITNAAEAVASFASDPALAVGDIVEVASGWGRLDKRVVRVKAVSGAGPFLVTLEGVNTLDTNKFPASAGAGSVREINTWQPITQIADISPSGGEQNYADSSDMDDSDDKQIPSNRSAEALSLTVHHDPALAWVSVVDAAEGVPTAFRVIYPGGARMLANAYFTRRTTPQLTRNETIKSGIDLTYAARPIEYPN